MPRASGLRCRFPSRLAETSTDEVFIFVRGFVAARMAIDPVCGTPVNPHTAYWMIWYKGTPYYFCNEECQMKFDRKPEHYRQLVLERRQKEAVY